MFYGLIKPAIFYTVKKKSRLFNATLIEYVQNSMFNTFYDRWKMSKNQLDILSYNGYFLV